MWHWEGIGNIPIYDFHTIGFSLIQFYKETDLLLVYVEVSYTSLFNIKQ